MLATLLVSWIAAAWTVAEPSVQTRIVTIDAASGLATSAATALSSSLVPNPAVTGPVPATSAPGDPAHGYPFFATEIDLGADDYVEEEFFLDGLASRYAITSPFATATVLDSGHPYRTRIVVRRPASRDNFNGTVLMEWQNVTTGYDLDALWAALHEHITRRGYAWVGVTAERPGVHATGTGLSSWSPARYGSLEISDDALQYDIFSQAGQAIRTPSGVDPMGGLRVLRIVAAGASRGANRLVTYHNSIHPLAGVVDGFMLFVGGGTLRTDLGAKAFKVLSETDVVGSQGTNAQAPIRQPDTDHYRTWEVAGAAHLDFDVARYLGPLRARDGIPASGADCALPPFSRVPFRFAGHAALDRMDEWIASGLEPPSAPPLEVVSLGPPVVVARDAYGNARGGLRLSQHDVATATNTGVNQPVNTFCRVYGSHQPFGEVTLALLYPEHGSYVSAVVRRTFDNLRKGYIVIEDASDTLRMAAMAAIGR